MRRFPLRFPLQFLRCTQLGASAFGLALMGGMALSATALTACNEHIVIEDNQPFTLELSVLEGDMGSKEAPLSTTEGDGQWPVRTYRLKVRALKVDGSVASDFSRRLHARVIPGRIDGNEWFTIEGGEGEVEVSVTRIFGETRIWLEDIGEEGQTASFATGVTPTIYVDSPTVSDIQYVPPGETCLSYVGTTLDGYECAALTNNFVRVRTDDRLLVVTAITTNGFYFSDCTDGIGLDYPCEGGNGNYRSLFAFNYSAPIGLFPGALLDSFAGNVTEFNGSTQISFPEWTLEPGLQVNPPEPQLMDEQVYCDPNDGFAQEPYEADLIRLENLVIKDFANDSNDLSGYNRFGQWPVYFKTTPTCEVTIVTRTTFPSFDPLANAGLELDFVNGNLSTYASVYSDVIQWTVLTRAASDLGCAGGNCPTE